MRLKVSAGAAVVAASFLAGVCGRAVAEEPYVTKVPTKADWTAVASLPDFTGVWEMSMGRPRPAAPKPASGAAAGTPAPARPPRPEGPKLTPAYEARRAALAAKGAEDNLTANCVPPGMPSIMGQPYPMEFLLTPGKLTIVIEAYMQVRHIYTDGRPLPEDPDATFNGHSVGRWDGKVLVVQSVGFSDQTLLAPLIPHGPNMKIEERFRLSDPDTMVIERTVTDPDALAEPWKSTATIKRHREYMTAEYICQENNRNYVTPEGKAGLSLDHP